MNSSSNLNGDSNKCLLQTEPRNMTTAGHELQKLTECSVCFQEFTDPRMLPCTHTFCLECLKQTFNTANKRPRGNMPCPLCKKMFLVPENGLDGLQKSLKVMANLQQSKTSAIDCDICKYLFEGDENTRTATMRCLECRDNFCEFCAKAHKLHKLSKDHHVVKIGSENEEDMSRISQNGICSDHNGKPLDYYCPRCKKAICASCANEKHLQHECKNVDTVEEEFRQAIEKIASKISIYADELLSKGRNFEQRMKGILFKFAEAENEIRKRNVVLKNLIDNETSILLEELSLRKQKHVKDWESEKEKIERSQSILKSFEAYCIEVKTKGSTGDICSCVGEIVIKATELEKDHEIFIGRPCQSIQVSFKATDLEDFLDTPSSSIVGQIQETGSQVESFVLIAGLGDGLTLSNDVYKVNLQCPNAISSQIQIPTRMRNGAAAAVYHERMYITGIGVKNNEIWEYDLAFGWVPCAPLNQGRTSHCAAFVDEVLYICGGSVASDNSVLDSVEGYNTIANTCTTVGKLVHCVESSGNCVPYKSSLYIFGGTDKDENEMNHVQVYNTKQNTCSLLSKPMPQAGSFMRAAFWETSVILVGCHTCLIFNLETENWQERKQFKSGVDHFGLALENDRIFVIGGGSSGTNESGNETWKCRDDVRFVPLKNIIDDKPFEWKNYAKLSKPALVQTYEQMTISCQKPLMIRHSFY